MYITLKLKALEIFLHLWLILLNLLLLLICLPLAPADRPLPVRPVILIVVPWLLTTGRSLPLLLVPAELLWRLLALLTIVNSMHLDILTLCALLLSHCLFLSNIKIEYYIII